jgi:5-methylcytosine-specific restriction endonuclease McrA
MKRDNNTLRRIFSRTDGRCHLCRKKLGFSNYGRLGRRGAWEIEHSRASVNGGTNHLNNLYSACIRCNRGKRHLSTEFVRKQNGYRCAPRSIRKKRQDAWTGAAIGSLAALFVRPSNRVIATILGSAAGAIVGYYREPE